MDQAAHLPNVAQVLRGAVLRAAVVAYTYDADEYVPESEAMLGLLWTVSKRDDLLIKAAGSDHSSVVLAIDTPEGERGHERKLIREDLMERLDPASTDSLWLREFVAADRTAQATLEAELASAMMSLPASKGFEIGSGFAGTRLTGLKHNDPFVPGEDGRPRTTTNRSGGVQGGISNGESIDIRVAFKPTATISSAQETVDSAGNAVTLEAQGRHDPCVLPRAVPMVEAMMCLVLADHWLRQRANDAL